VQVLAQLSGFAERLDSDQSMGNDPQPHIPTLENYAGGASSSQGATALQIDATVVPDGASLEGGELHAVRLCIVCDTHERVVRFGCGHALVCSRCLVRLHDEGEGRYARVVLIG
jgi:hypothetical protein